MENTEAQDIVESVAKNSVVTKAYEKLNRKCVDMDVPRQLTLLETIESVLISLKADSPDKTNQIAEAEQQIESLRKDSIIGTLVPLKTTDMFLVQGLIAETAMKGKEMGFEMDVQLFIMTKAERCGTIYLSLRKRNNIEERYFKNQEEVLEVDDRVMQEIVKVYRDNFMLTEVERKNS